MANIKIQQLTEKTVPSENDVLIIEDATTTSKITYGDLTKTQTNFINKFQSDLKHNGYAVLGDLTIQWGSHAMGANEDMFEVIYPKTFNNACFSFVATGMYVNKKSVNYVTNAPAYNKTNVYAWDNQANAVPDFVNRFTWIAVGY